MTMKCTRIVIAALLILHPTSSAYRIKGSDDEHKPFAPYEKGFVQNALDHAVDTASRRVLTKRRYALSAVIGEIFGNVRLFSCPNMVGPFSNDGNYFCTSDVHGMCDRTSGICICNEGYAGEACDTCDDTTHFEIAGFCYKKRQCPNDCSYAGRCNHLTGVCECSDHRVGDDCSTSKCDTFHPFCTHCNEKGCIDCEEGFSVHKDSPHGAQCEPCWRFDPRCRDCNADACTSCIDMLLLSIHRSGRRLQDPPLPVDELSRELSVTVPFGSQQVDAFYDAEYYFLVDPSLVPLNESAVECHQGLNYDDSITCFQYLLTSHIMCGNYGTITFESPEYAVREDEGHIRLTIQRTGGGVGEVAVSYSIYPMTAGYDDVTSTAYYTTNQIIVFRPGQIRATFLLTINDDRIFESNEMFSVHLSNAKGGVIGTQSRTIVTIIDDDAPKTCSNNTSLGHSHHDLGSVEAGTPFQFNIIAKTCVGSVQTIDGDTWKVEARIVGSEIAPNDYDTPVALGSCDYTGDGTYACNVDATVGGKYNLDVYQLISGGLKGYYYTDNYLSNERLDNIRVDAVVNFTWGEGAVTTFGRDFVSVRWEGFVRPVHSETYTFWLEADDHARLWIDGVLLIDSWTFSPTTMMLHAQHNLTAQETHELILEYREIRGKASARLLWSSASTNISAIPSDSLLYKEPIHNSPFSFVVFPSHPSAKETRAFGQGLYQGIAGKAHSFIIEPRDRFGNLIGRLQNNAIADYLGSAEIIDDTELGLGNSRIPVTISYNSSTFQYVSSWTPGRSGIYRLNVTLLHRSQGTEMDENHIFGSPFLVTTSSGITSAPESIAEGGDGHCPPWVASPCPGIYHGMVGKESSFFIKSFDRYRNARKSGGDNWKVVLVSTSSTDYYPGRVLDGSNGIYSAFVTPAISGPNDLHVTLDDAAITGSPFRMDVVHGLVSGAASFVVNEEEVITMMSLEENTLVIQATDEFGNDAIYCNEYPFETSVVVEGENVDTSKTRVHYVGAGVYSVTVTNLNFGSMNVTVKINDYDIKHSPFNITVLPGAFSASKSAARGEGLSRATAGEEQHFVIQSKDVVGNDKMDNEAQSFDVRLIRGDSDSEVEVIGMSNFVGDGQYAVNYTCYESGDYVMHIRDTDGVDIAGSPFQVTVAPAAISGPHSLVSGQGLLRGVAGDLAEVRVYGRDKYMNSVSHSVEVIEMTMTLTSRHQSDWEGSQLSEHVGSNFIHQLARDSGEGVFFLDYIPKLSGTYELKLTTYSPGGLDGAHFSSPDLLPDYLVSTSTDNIVEKYYDDDPIGELVGTQALLGSVWNGKIAAHHDEEYTIIVQCNEEGYASIAVNGKFVPWQSCYPMTSTTVVLKASRAVNFSLRYRSLEGSAFVVLMWSSPSVPMEKIPSRNLFHQVTVGDTALHRVEIVPNANDTSKSTALGNSLTSAIAGIEQEFLIECRDGFGSGEVGNLALNGGANLEVVLINYENQDDLQAIVLDNNNGTYFVQYTALRAGDHFLSITVNESSVKGSPFLLRVEPGETEAEETILLKQNMLEFVTGREIGLEIQTMDSNRNKRNAGNDEIIAVLSRLPVKEHQSTLNCKSEYVIDGLYTVTCPAASISGSYLLDIGILTSSGSHPIKSSPFPITIVPGRATAETTSITGLDIWKDSVKLISKAGRYETFSVRSHDRFNNALNTGGDHFIARVRGDTRIESSEKQIEVIDQGNGSYIFAYRLSQPSTYEIDVNMVTGTGLVGSYYADGTSFKAGIPERLVIDEQINFSIRRLDEKNLFSNIVWTGFLSFPHTSDFEFDVTGVEGSFKLWIGDRIVLDTDDGSTRGSFRSIVNIVYEIKIEYYLDINRLLLQLFWSSRRMARNAVPKHHFFSSSEPIRGSPFHLTVTR